MPLAKTQFASFIRNFDLRNLFNEMGWDNDRTAHPIAVDGVNYHVQAIAEKAGFKVLQVETNEVPNYAVRRKIQFAVSKYFAEHLLIFTDKIQQCWQLVVREFGKPLAVRETPWLINQDPELLYQRLQNVFFDLDEQDNITIVDVKNRLKENFTANAEKVTKKFYEAFKKEHDAFAKFITGIDEISDKNWYTSVMLNRLMFVYFLQKKGFLDGNIHYLGDKLAAYKNFHNTFYRDFLLAFFHQGLGQREHSPELVKKLGKIPYLNGGFFDVHALEIKYGEERYINIEDEAFEKLFAFFDQWEWHLDTRPSAKGNEVNPDVVGYIFEKYINQKQMGAYYTKEDITDYISKNVIIPFLFDKADIDETNPCWQLLQDDPDRYIYPAVLHGVIDRTTNTVREIPEHIACGLDTRCNYATLKERRKDWNKAAPRDNALPTETWREYIARRTRCLDVRQKLLNGEVKNINDFITCNLNIRQFAQDAVSILDEAARERFAQALRNVKILDPTCGSGAFLFAALNILEPLRQASENEHTNSYHTLKQIILNNLYGVDIMPEAVEICKLRLFLKLASYIDRPEDIEPLPDIDFNIRCGNTLIGFATLDEVKASAEQTFDFDKSVAKIVQDAAEIDGLFTAFREQQLSEPQHPAYGHFTANIKEQLRQQLDILRKQLDDYWYPQSSEEQNPSEEQSGKCFHWFIEFYGIFQSGGFDCIIGNPPYVEYSKIKKEYTLRNYKTEQCGNLYAFVMERSFALLNQIGRNGMIIPHSSVCTDRMETLISLFQKYGLWLSFFDIRPSQLFDGIDQRLLICLSNSKFNGIITSKYHRWNTEDRQYLFEILNYIDDVPSLISNSIPKASQPVEKSLISLLQKREIIQHLYIKSGVNIYYHNAPRYFNRIMSKPPYFWNDIDGEKISLHVKELSLTNKNVAGVVGAVLNSNLFYWWFILFSNCRDLARREIDNFPLSIDTMRKEYADKLAILFEELNKDFEKHKFRKECQYKATGKVIYDEYYPSKSKPIIDRIDEVLAEHYGFTAAELDFIINYDIKYRLGGAEE